MGEIDNDIILSPYLFKVRKKKASDNVGKLPSLPEKDSDNVGKFPSLPEKDSDNVGKYLGLLEKEIHCEFTIGKILCDG